MDIPCISFCKWLLLLLHTFLYLTECRASSLDLVDELRALQSQSASGVIRLNDHLVSRYLTSTKTPRPYHILIFFDAAHLHDKADLHLPELKREFSILSSSYLINNPFPPPRPSKPLFFCDVELKESQNIFTLFGVNSIPHVRLVAHDARTPKDSIRMEQEDFSRLAFSMAKFIQIRIGIEIGPIHRPPPISKNLLALLFVSVLISTPFVFKRVLSGQTPLHSSKIWLSGALFIYFFSVSGSMHNIIRNAPMVLPDRENPSKLIYFYKGSGMQLGAEGFAVGSLYTVVGVVLGVIVHFVVRIRNRMTQRVIMVVGMGMCLWAVGQVILLDNWKTGYRVHAFW